MNIIGHKYIFLTIGALLTLGGIAAFLVWGLRAGIDFTGGSLMELEFNQARPSADEIRKTLEPQNLGSVSVQPVGDKGVMLRFKHIDEKTHQEIIKALGMLNTGMQNGENVLFIAPQSSFEKRFDTIGPTIGQELKTRSFLAVILAVFAIILYITWAFRHVSKPLNSWKYGVVAVATLLHDIAIPIGVFSFLGHYRNIEIDPLFITALLTIMGFSVHDTIVVFDRIRENLRKLKAAELFDITVNRSVNETLARSLNTSLTVLLVLAAIYIWGGATVEYFALALIIGISFGTYSSIFVASPLLVIWNNISRRRQSNGI